MPVTWSNPPTFGVDAQSAMKVDIDWSGWDVYQEMDNFALGISQAILEYANDTAPQIASWMKKNAVWQDRTGAARAGLDARVANGSASRYVVDIVCSYDVPYGPFLETMQGGRFSIFNLVEPYWIPRIEHDVSGLNRRITAIAGWRG